MPNRHQIDTPYFLLRYWAHFVFKFKFPHSSNDHVLFHSKHSPMAECRNVLSEYLILSPLRQCHIVIDFWFIRFRFFLLIWILNSFSVEVFLYDSSKSIHNHFKPVFRFFWFWMKILLYQIYCFIWGKCIFKHYCFFSKLMYHNITFVENSIPDTVFIDF